MLNDQQNTAKWIQSISVNAAVDRVHSVFFFVFPLLFTLLLLNLSRLV